MNQIGHNNPPPEMAIGAQVAELFAMLSDTIEGSVVTNDAQEAGIQAMADEFAKLAKAADKDRAAEKEPFLKAGREIDAKWKPIIAEAESGRKAALSAITPYRDAKLKAKREEEARIREEAEAAERAARAVLAKSDNAKEKFEAEQAFKQAEKLKAAANKMNRAATGMRTVWEAEIVDRKAALLCLIKRNPGAFEELIQRMADQAARGDRAPIDGVVFHERRRAA